MKQGQQAALAIDSMAALELEIINSRLPAGSRARSIRPQHDQGPCGGRDRSLICALLASFTRPEADKSLTAGAGGHAACQMQGGQQRNRLAF